MYAKKTAPEEKADAKYQIIIFFFFFLFSQYVAETQRKNTIKIKMNCNQFKRFCLEIVLFQTYIYLPDKYILKPIIGLETNMFSMFFPSFIFPNFNNNVL